ncbi:MBL fold metallo-hydrolase [Streptomyces coeruleorubidus]|uniref:MBL fold metallo-hydrolase n=1 Tax=Streptomyces coeruleorubidus TaxID=116188 RepID=UPI00367F4B19
MRMQIPSELTQIGSQTYAWLPDCPGTWGMANCVLVASDSDEALLVDTPYTSALTRALTAAAHRVLPASATISTVVNTHANGDHSYGNGLFPDAEIISTEASLGHLCAEPGPEQLHAMLDQCRPDDPFGRYLLAHFGRYDYRGLKQTPPTRTFNHRLELRTGSTDVQLIEVGPAHTIGDLIVHLPDSGIVCAGDVVFIGDVPVHWAGPLEGVVQACRQILDLNPRLVVPGHGPLVGADEVRAHMNYVAEMRDRIHDLHGAGLPMEDAASVLLRERRGADLGLSERLAVLTATEYRHLDQASEPLNLVATLSTAVRLAPDCIPAQVPDRAALMAEFDASAAGRK